MNESPDLAAPTVKIWPSGLPVAMRVILSVGCAPAVLLVIGLIILTAADVIGRYLFGSPIAGSQDIISFALPVVFVATAPFAGAVLGYRSCAKEESGHGIGRWVAGGVTITIIVLVLAVLAYASIDAAIRAVTLEEVSDELQLPIAYRHWAVAAGAVLAIYGTLAAGIAGFLSPGEDGR